MKSIGTLGDVAGSAAPPATTDIEARLANIEKTLILCLSEIADLNERLDRPAQQPKPKPKPKPNGKEKAKATEKAIAKEKPTPPSELITALLTANGPMSRAEMQEHLPLDEEQIKKCLNWMYKNHLVRKHDTEKDDAGNSRWILIS